MTERWNQRVERYLDDLQETNETIDLILDETRVSTVNVKSTEIDQSRAALTEAIVRLEQMIPRREILLKADDAPAEGFTLTEKLLATHKIDDARLARRCNEVAGRIDTTRERAVSLFVCQFHLAALGRDLIDLLSGAAGDETYGPSNADGRDSKTTRGLGQDRRGGGLFNEAA